MTYPGNPTLSPEIQDRILTTFRQTLSLAEKGERQDALLGCDFILRLDPVFEPARLLQGRLQKSEGAVSIDDFGSYLERAGDEDAQGPEQVAPEPPPIEGGVDLDSLDLELDLGDEEAAAAPPAAPPAAPADPAASLREELTRLFEERRFKEVKALAEREGDLVRSEPELRQVATRAAEIIEAEPYLLGFLDSARKAVQSGQSGEARALLAKARELDPGHPGVAALEREVRPPSEEEPGEAAAPARKGPAEESAHRPPSSEEVAAEFLSAEALLGEEDSMLGASLDSESEDRITQLLEEGQTAFQNGEYQGAIDAWSRIFLIDIDHTEANRRIELARKLKAEVERKIEEAFHEGITSLEAGSPDEARAAFEQVLEMQPNHLGAREYLQRIEQGELAAPAAPPPPGAPADLPESLPDLDEAGEAVEGLAAPDASPVPLEVPAAGRGRAVAAAISEPSGRRRLFAILGGVVLVLVVAGAWLLYSRRSQMFPNTADQPQAAAVQQDPIERAQALHDDGKTSMAVAQLRRLPPQHPKYAEAQGLIALWEIGSGPEPVEPEGPSEEQLARRNELLSAARRALDRGSALTADRLLRSAALVAPLGDDATQLRSLIEESLELYRAELDLFRQGDWEFALRNLWRIYEDNPDNPDLRQLIVDTYFNMGVRSLQRADPEEAGASFAEALDLAPDDDELQRLVAFAEAYQERRSDLLYRIFVKYYPFRSHGTQS